MRRRPDGKSLGPLHDVIWQSAAVGLGVRPGSEAEYTAGIGPVSPPGRDFPNGPPPRNDPADLQKTIGSQEEPAPTPVGSGQSALPGGRNLVHNRQQWQWICATRSSRSHRRHAQPGMTPKRLELPTTGK